MAFGNARHLHVAEKRHRVVRAGLAIDEHAALRIPARMQIRIGVLQEGQFRARRKAAIERVEPNMSFAGRPLLIGEEVRLIGCFEAKRTDGAMVSHRPPRTSSVQGISAFLSRPSVRSRQRRDASQAPPDRDSGCGSPASHRIDEVAVLAYRTGSPSARRTGRPPDIDHDVAVGQFNRQTVAKYVKPNAMAPAQQACRADVSRPRR